MPVHGRDEEFAPLVNVFAAASSAWLDRAIDVLECPRMAAGRGVHALDQADAGR